METTRNVYIIIAVLFIIPLIGFNISKIFTKNAQKKLVFKPIRAIAVAFASILIGVFLFASYKSTIKNRYEIFVERVAAEHSKFIIQKTDFNEFSKFIEDNKSSKANFETPKDSSIKGKSSVRFRISDSLTPQFWKNKEGLEQVEKINDDIPAYTLYFIEKDGAKDYYLLRITKEDGDWKIDDISAATEELKSNYFRKLDDISRKWYEVK